MYWLHPSLQDFFFHRMHRVEMYYGTVGKQNQHSSGFMALVTVFAFLMVQFYMIVYIQLFFTRKAH